MFCIFGASVFNNVVEICFQGYTCILGWPKGSFHIKAELTNILANPILYIHTLTHTHICVYMLYMDLIDKFLKYIVAYMM